MAGTTLGTAYVQIVPSAEGIKGSITNALGGEAASAGTSTGSKIASFAKKALVAGAVGKFIKDTLEEGGKLQQSYIGGLETLYGDSAEAARENARAAAQAGISMNEYAEQAVSFGAALKQAFGGDTAKAAKVADMAIMDMADNAAKMGTDIGSIQDAYQGFAKQNYTMLDNLKLGYGGTKSEMERLLADAEKITGIHYDIDNLGDVYEAIHVIQGEVGLTGVAAEEASQTFSGSFAAMKAAYMNFIGSLALGEDVGEAMKTLVTSAGTFIFGNLVPMLGTIVKALPGAIAALIQTAAPLIVDNMVALLESITEKVKTFASSITGTKVQEWATTVLPKILSSAGELIAKYAGALIKNLPQIWLAVGKIALAIYKGLGSAIWAKVTAAANGIKERFLAPINNLRDKIKSIIDKIKSFFSFKISKPHVPLPHFSINPAGWKLKDLLKGSIPHLSVKWFAEGGIVDGPTLFGAGEAGPEAIMPLEKLKDYTAIDYDRLAGAIVSGLSRANHTTVVEIDGKAVARTTAPYMETELNHRTKMNNRKLGYI